MVGSPPSVRKAGVALHGAALGLLASHVLACAPPADEEPAEVEEDPPQVDDRRCKPGPGATGSPESIVEAVDLINSLPMPVTAACLVESLDRPLFLEATQSVFSAQPSDGPESPRLFIFEGPLLISVVPGGPSRNLVEFGEFVSSNRTIKAELEFPFSEPIEATAAFERVLHDEREDATSCGICHDAETPSVTVPGGYESVAYRPSDDGLVPVESLNDQFERCDIATDSERCAYLEALVSHGYLVHQPFSEDLPTFFD